MLRTHSGPVPVSAPTPAGSHADALWVLIEFSLLAWEVISDRMGNPRGGRLSERSLIITTLSHLADTVLQRNLVWRVIKEVGG